MELSPPGNTSSATAYPRESKCTDVWCVVHLHEVFHAYVCYALTPPSPHPGPSRGRTCDPDAEIFGFDTLTTEEQACVREELQKTGIPEHLKEIDPEDPKFLGKKELPRVPAPSAVSLSLLPYQEEGYGWMVRQEREHHCRGGILADEM